jgi:hypothetical protein
MRKPERKRPGGRPRCRLGNNIKMNLKALGREGVDWIHMAQCTDQWWAIVNIEMKLVSTQIIKNFPVKGMKFLD